MLQSVEAVSVEPPGVVSVELPGVVSVEPALVVLAVVGFGRGSGDSP